MINRKINFLTFILLSLLYWTSCTQLNVNTSNVSINKYTYISTLHEFNEFSIEPLPEWTNPYSNIDKGDMRFFNIPKLMERFLLKRYEAVEVQSGYRVKTRERVNEDKVKLFNEALFDVKVERKLESNLRITKLDKSPFIIVMDLDETLYQQSSKLREKCYDFISRQDGKKLYIKMAPNWERFINKINELGGSLVIYSAYPDEGVSANLSSIYLDGVPLSKNPKIKGVLTNSFLIRQEKFFGDVVQTPSKDLRILDEYLRKVIIIDDNPKRLFQFQNARLVKKFDAISYCFTEKEEVKKTIELSLDTVLNEIQESYSFLVKMKEEGGKIDFKTAYLPYTALGGIALNAIIKANNWDRKRAISFIRQNPEIVDIKF